MLAKFPSATPPHDAHDVAQLTAGLQSCLALADKLHLDMVAIHVEQARAWLVDHGLECPAGPKPSSEPHHDQQP